MPAVRELCYLFGLSPQKLSKDENVILEAELFRLICEELNDINKLQSINYFNLLKFNTEKENEMIDSNFIRCIVRDILTSEEYNLPGIACYSNTTEDVIYEVAIGQNNSPSLSLARKIIDLHRSVRPALYESIVKKILVEKLALV